MGWTSWLRAIGADDHGSAFAPRRHAPANRIVMDAGTKCLRAICTSSNQAIGRAADGVRRIGARAARRPRLPGEQSILRGALHDDVAVDVVGRAVLALERTRRAGCPDARQARGTGSGRLLMRLACVAGRDDEDRSATRGGKKKPRPHLQFHGCENGMRTRESS